MLFWQITVPVPARLWPSTHFHVFNVSTEGELLENVHLLSSITESALDFHHFQAVTNSAVAFISQTVFRLCDKGIGNVRLDFKQADSWCTKQQTESGDKPSIYYIDPKLEKLKLVKEKAVQLHFKKEGLKSVGPVEVSDRLIFWLFHFQVCGGGFVSLKHLFIFYFLLICPTAKGHMTCRTYFQNWKLWLFT